MRSPVHCFALITLLGCASDPRCDPADETCSLDGPAHVPADSPAARENLAPDDDHTREPQTSVGPGMAPSTEDTPLVSAFARLTIRSAGGIPWPRAADATCDQSYLNTFTVDVSARELRWDYCGGGATTRVLVGARSLSDAELQLVLNTAAQVKPSRNAVCGADKPQVTLEVEGEAGSITYTDDFYACSPRPGVNAISDIDPLAQTLRFLASAPPLPAVPERLNVAGSSGPDAPSDPRSTCHPKDVSRYEFVPATSSVRWERCRALPGTTIYALQNESRLLSAAELERVLLAYRNVAYGASMPCAQPAQPPSFLTAEIFQDDARLVTLYDESGSCTDGWVYGVFATNLAPLIETIAALVP